MRPFAFLRESAINWWADYHLTALVVLVLGLLAAGAGIWLQWTHRPVPVEVENADGRFVVGDLDAETRYFQIDEEETE